MGFWNSLSPTAKVVTVALCFAAMGGQAFAAVVYFGPIWLTELKPTQPIPFSHKLHAGDNKIPCQYCHTNARRSEAASIPDAQKCMNCHDYVKPEAPDILKVAAHAEKQEPIEWLKVFDLPDHVWFNHKRHIKKDIKCQECHGPIETMDVVSRANTFKMGFCLNCHQKNDAPTDCWTCHT